MRLYTLQKDGKYDLAVGFVDGGEVYAFSENGMKFDKMLDLIEAWTPELAEKLTALEGAGKASKLADYKICSPIPFPHQEMLCLGVNYYDHAKEALTISGEDFITKREKTIYFTKHCAYSQGPGDPIPLHPEYTSQVDYETELAAVIGATIRDVKREDALDCVFGYTIVNDVSARDLQQGHKQWFRGKSLDGFAPMGPCIVTADEIPDPQNLEMKGWVNGELRQHSNTKMMMQDVAGAISELSEGMTILAGTVIATGTPAGVAAAMKPPVFLKKGDVVRMEIEKIGVLENTVE